MWKEAGKIRMILVGFEDGGKGGMSQEFMQSVETGKDKKTDSPLEPPEEIHPC